MMIVYECTCTWCQNMLNIDLGWAATYFWDYENTFACTSSHLSPNSKTVPNSTAHMMVTMKGQLTTKISSAHKIAPMEGEESKTIPHYSSLCKRASKLCLTIYCPGSIHIFYVLACQSQFKLKMMIVLGFWLATYLAAFKNEKVCMLVEQLVELQLELMPLVCKFSKMGSVRATTLAIHLRILHFTIFSLDVL